MYRTKILNNFDINRDTLWSWQRRQRNSHKIFRPHEKFSAAVASARRVLLSIKPRCFLYCFRHALVRLHLHPHGNDGAFLPAERVSVRQRALRRPQQSLQRCRRLRRWERRAASMLAWVKLLPRSQFCRSQKAWRELLTRRQMHIHSTRVNAETTARPRILENGY